MLEAFGQTEGNVDDVIRPSLVANNERQGEADVLITVMEEEKMDLVEQDRFNDDVVRPRLDSNIGSHKVDQLSTIMEEESDLIDRDDQEDWVLVGPANVDERYHREESSNDMGFEKMEIFSRGDVKISKCKDIEATKSQL